MNAAAPARILVVDDDPALRELLADYLGASGFVVDTAVDGRQMHERIAQVPPDAIVLDLMLPGEDGLSLARELRKSSEVPILMVSARGEEIDRVVGLEVGADDYLPKPFSPRELVARIHAVLRRRAAPPPPGAPAITEESVSFGKVTINLATRELEREGTATLLTSGEFGLLRVLLEHPRQPMSRDKLMELARGREYEVFDRAIDVQISRLRKLVEEDPAKPRYIQTVWGFGYVFVPDGKKHD